MHNQKGKRFRQLAIAVLFAVSVILPPVSMPENYGMDTAVVTRAAAKSFSVKDVPKYAGKPTVRVNGNNPYFTEREKKNTKAFESYHKLDKLGRCGVAYANVCRELMPTEERGAIGAIKPTGWHTVKYNGVVDGNYLYNRCHLIAYCLTAENANKKNLITGTRYLNNEGMLPYEIKVAQYVENTRNHVLYRVTPIFEGNNLLASGVLMEAYSVEDKGKGISFCIYAYNVQPGITINYKNGDSKLFSGANAGSGSNSGADTKKDSDTSNDTSASVAKQTYILNTNTKKFHKPDCRSVNQMSEKNKKEVNDTRDHIIADGYDPCKICNP